METQAREDLAAGRFRKARDSYKLLCKENREKYLPALIEANCGLAEQLLERGQASEAEQVLAYLKTLAPAGALLGTDLRAALKSHQWEKAAAIAARIASDQVAGERDRASAADALVLAFPATDAPASPEPLRADLAAISGALRCVSEGQYEQAQELLRPVPRGSIFSGWKMFIKGMVAFHTGDAQKAAMLFGQLPDGGVPARAALAYRQLCGGDAKGAKPEAGRESALEGACHLLGAPGLGAVLPLADRLWAEGRLAESYREMCRAAEFPSEQPDLAGALSAFYFRSGSSLREAQRERYLRSFAQQAQKRAFKNAVEARWIFLLLGQEALHDPFSPLCDDLEIFWQEFLRQLPDGDPDRAKIAALVFERLGNFFAEPDLDPLPFSFGPSPEQMRDARRAAHFLRESIAQDPAHLPASLALLKVYETGGKTSQRNRLLDQMTERFPNEKAVLVRAGALCLERKALAKGVEYLERARGLDALDRDVLNVLVNGYLQLARQQYEKRALGKARQTFEVLLRYAERETTDVLRGLDFLVARQGVLETVFGDAVVAERLLAAAREASGSLPALVFFMHAYYRIHARAPAMTGPFWAAVLQQSPQTATQRLELLLALRAARSIDEQMDWKAENDFVRACLARVAGAAFAPDEAAELVPVLATDPPFAMLADQLVQAGLRASPGDLRFRLFAILLRKDRMPGPPEIQEVTEIREAAVRQGDVKTAKLAGIVLEDLRRMLPPVFDDFADDEDDIFEADGVEDEDDSIPSDEIADIQRTVAEMGDAEFARFRKQIGKIMPLPIFDGIVGKVRKKKGTPPAEAWPAPAPEDDPFMPF